MAEIDLQIQHLQIEYRLQGRRPAGEVRNRLDAIARRGLAAALERQLPEPAPDDGFYYLPTLELDLVLNPAQSEGELARQWAEAIWRQLSRQLAAGGSEVVCFPSLAELLAAYLTALSRGEEPAPWLTAFLPVPAGLSVGARLVHHLTRDPDAGRGALLLLRQRGELVRLLAQFSPAELQEVVSRCLLPPSPWVVPPGQVTAWLRAWRHLLQEGQGCPSGDRWRDLLQIYLDLCLSFPELGPDVNLARFVGLVLEAYYQGHLRYLGETMSALPPDAVELPLPDSTPMLAYLWQREAAPAEAAAFITALTAESGTPAEKRWWSPVAGLWLLLPALLDLELPAFLAPWEEAFSAPGVRGQLLLLVLSQSLGAEGLTATLADPVVRLLAGMEEKAELVWSLADQDPWPTSFLAAWRQHLHQRRQRPEFYSRRSQQGQPPADHLAWLSAGLTDPPISAPVAVAASLAEVSWTLGRWFAAGLGSLAASSPGYLARNFWQSPGCLVLSAERLQVRFTGCPLQVLLRLAGFASRSWPVPWLAGRQLEFAFGET